MTAAEAIESGLDALTFDCPFDERYVRYLEELERWNRTYNLTAVRTVADMVSHHLLDSLSALPWLNGRDIIDVGSGGGLPGIPFAIACPDRHFTLLDSNGKKTRFLTHARIALGLENVTVVQSRIESWQETYDQVVCRAVASLDQLAGLCVHLVRPGGNLLAMKSADESPGAEAAMVVSESSQVVVPGIAAERWIIVLSRRDGLST